MNWFEFVKTYWFVGFLILFVFFVFHTVYNSVEYFQAGIANGTMNYT